MKIKNYETFGVMIDMSRNAVMSVEALKKYFVYLSKMGYNCAMLYTEERLALNLVRILGVKHNAIVAHLLKNEDISLKSGQIHNGVSRHIDHNAKSFVFVLCHGVPPK